MPDNKRAKRREMYFQEQYAAIRITTKNKIHSAAIKPFAKNGFAAISVKDIQQFTLEILMILIKTLKLKLMYLNPSTFNSSLKYSVKSFPSISA